VGKHLFRLRQKRARGEWLGENLSLNGEIFYSLREARVVIEKWRVANNTLRPPSALGYYRPSATAVGCA
jgi:transposase InsO family protein